MRINSSSSFLLSDTLVADVFISDYLNRLSRDAIRCYLTLLQTFQHGKKKITTADLGQRLGISKNDAEKALSDLQKFNLIVIQAGQLNLVDLKMVEAKKLWQSEADRTDISSNQLSQREKIIKQINDTFFQGVMALGFYSKIDEWFNRYEFEPEVVYAIFSEAAGKNKLEGPGYVSGIADNWAANGVKTYRQLNRYYKDYAERREISQKIRKKLNYNQLFSVYQEELIDKWVRDYAYDFSVIDLALQETVNLTSPSLKYIDSVLTQWHEKGLKNVEEIRQDQANFQRRKQQAKSAPNRHPKSVGVSSTGLDQEDQADEELYNVDLIRLLSEQGD